MEVRGLVFSYGKNRVLDDTSLLIERGKVTTIMGGNGCGKSTLFALMTKNLVPDRGKVFLRGRDVRAMGLKDFARHVSIVHQNNVAPDDMTVEQLVRLGRAPHLRPMSDMDEEDERLVNWALRVTGIEPYRERELARLSGGQRQRAWIAMALAQNTKVLFLDEPTTYLDVRYQIEVLDLTRRLNREFGMTIVMVLHDVNQAIAYSDVIVGLKDGRVAFNGDPQLMVTRESMRDLFDIDLEIAQADGRKVVLLRGENADPVSPDAFEAPPPDGVPLDEAPPDGAPSDRADLTGQGTLPFGMEGSSGPLPASSLVSPPESSPAPLSTPSPAPPSARAGSEAGEASPTRAGSTLGASSAHVGVLEEDGRPSASRRASEPARSRSRVARVLWTGLGLVCFALGTVGAVLPILPTVPFYLAALFCFAKGSRRLHDWFVGTSLYHKHLAGFADHRGMTMRTKLSIMGMVTLVMGIAFALMGSVPVGRVVIAIVWVAHVVYFMGFVKTDKTGGADVGEEELVGGDGAVGFAGTGEPGQGKRKEKGGMIKTRLVELLQHARIYIVYQVLWQWAALLCQIATIFIVTGLLRLLLEGALTPFWMVTAVVALAVILVVRFACDRKAVRNSHAAGADVKRVVRERIYEKLLRLGASYKDHVSTSEVVQMSVEGAEQLETYFGKYLSQLFYSLIAPLTLFAALVWYNWQASLVLLACVPLIPIVIMVVQRIARRLLNKYWDIYTDLGDSFLDNLQGLTTLKIYRSDAQAADKMDAESERFRRVTMKVLSMQLNSIIIMDVVAYGGAAVGMSVAISQFIAGNVDVAGTLMIILLSAEFFIPMRLLGSFFHIAMNGMAASDKMFAFLDLEEPVQGGQPVGEDGTGIRMASVGFGYDESRQVLDDVSMEFPVGSFVSLVGESGCGKSTIARVLTGRNKGYSGSIELGGVQLSDIDESSLMSYVTLISSNSYLFKGTVIDNLCVGNPDAGVGDMRRALAAVNLEAYLDTQQGLDTPIDEGGANLSGGQRQRLALARALLHDTPCYIFDEATSNIDVESEEVIMEVIRGLAREKTVILISHRLANVVESDRIYLLEDGRIAESGTHDQLMNRQGSYARLYSRQLALELYGKEAVA